jgi:parallel beta-helix repeat protein
MYGQRPEGEGRMKNLITCLVVCVLSGVTFADTWTVDDDGKADFDNIQAAVDAASDGDEIVVMPGTYTSTQDGHVVNMLGKAVWLHSSEGQEVTFIDGEGVRRGILCDSGETSNTSIEGFTITNGYSGYDAYGGGMRNYNSSPTLTNCTFTSNFGINYGGGMYNTSSSNPTLTNCTFDSNTAHYGGGMCNSSSNPTLTNCTFTNNTANSGGGMYNVNSSSPTLTNCTFENNTAASSGGGGGMSNNGNSSSPTLTNCTFTDNTANNGGGGMSTNSSPMLTNCTFTGNAATGGNGGGIWISGGNGLMLENCTLCSNTPNQISGLFIDEGGNTIAAICPVPGACCTNDGCVVSEEENCITFLGSWLGEGTTCVENPCPTECPGDMNSDGQVNVNDLMILIAYWGACP